MKTANFLIVLPLAAFLALAACENEPEDKTTTTSETPEPEHTPDELPKGVLVKEKHIAFLTSVADPADPYTIKPVLETGQAVRSWASDKPAVATAVRNGKNCEVTPKSAGSAIITLTPMSGPSQTWTVTVIKTDPPAQKSIAAKFGGTDTNKAGVTQTLTALHDFLQTLPEDTEKANTALRSVIALGDTLDLPTLSIPAATPYTSNPAKTLIVVGINSFVSKNENGTAPHIVLHFEGVPANGPMNTTRTNAGGYEQSGARAYLINTFLPALIKAGVPADIILSPKRYVWNAASGDASDVDLIEDKLWLPTERELFGQNHYSSSLESNANQARLEYYDFIPDPGNDPNWQASHNTRRKTMGAGVMWWTASPTSGSTTNFCSIISDGSSFSNGSFADNGTVGHIVPAFCIK